MYSDNRFPDPKTVYKRWEGKGKLRDWTREHHEERPARQVRNTMPLSVHRLHRAPDFDDIVRVTIANITPVELAHRVQAAGLAATIVGSWGAGDWGVEPGATAEFAGTDPDRVRQFTQTVLQERGEQAAYVVQLRTADSESDHTQAYLLLVGKERPSR